MQFVVERNTFLKELTRVTGVIAAKSTIPILANVRIDAGAGGLLLRATDLEMEAEAPCDADVTSQGLTTVDGRLLADFVKRCPDGAQIAATLEPDRGRLKLVCGRTRSTLPVLPAEDFPTISGAWDKSARSFLVHAPDLKTMIERVRFAISTIETDVMFHGIYLHQVGDKLACVATNRHQLSRYTLPLPDGADGLEGVILPKKFFNELTRLLPSEGEAAIEVSRDRVQVTVGEFRLLSNLVAAKFPDQYERVIPSGSPRTAFVDRESLEKAVQRLAIMLDKEQSGIQVTFAKGEIRMAAANDRRGNCFDAVDAECDAEETVMAVNYRYLLDILGTWEAKRLYFGFSGEHMASVKVNAADEVDSQNCMVLCPMAMSTIKEEREAA